MPGAPPSLADRLRIVCPGPPHNLASGKSGSVSDWEAHHGTMRNHAPPESRSSQIPRRGQHDEEGI